MRVKIDLHIHSCLSACADEQNTLCNIVNLAGILEQKIIAIADHNCVENFPAAKQLGEQSGIKVIPAMEVTTAEEIHVLCLFRNYADAVKVQQTVLDSLPHFPVDKRIYNAQLVRDAEDNTVREIPYLLNVACGIDVYTLCDLVLENNGIPIPAHIDKDSNSITAMLGEVPPDLPVTALEISPNCPQEVIDKYSKYLLLRSSDAHSLESMCRHEFELELSQISVDALFEALGKGRR